MRIALALILAGLLPTMLFIGGCSGEDAKAAKQKKLKESKEQLRQVYTQIEEFQNSPEFKDATTASFKAQKELVMAKRSKDESRIADAQSALEEAAAAGNLIFAKKDQLDTEKNRLRDKVLDLGGKP
jgi:hypothetical protein